MVFGRSKTKGFFDKRRVETGEEEWVVAENTHEPLISQELWDTVHQMMKARRRENGKGEVQPFAGLVKCADCGYALSVSKANRTWNSDNIIANYDYQCNNYRMEGKAVCTQHRISALSLYNAVIEGHQAACE